MYNGTEAEGRESFKFLYELGGWTSFLFYSSTHRLRSGPVMDLAKEIPYEALNTFHVSLFINQVDEFLLTFRR